MQEIYFFISPISGNQNKGVIMNNNKITKYIFGLSALIIVLYLAINTNKVNSKKISDSKKIIKDESKKINKNDFSLTNQSADDLDDTKLINLRNDQDMTLELDELNEKNDSDIVNEKTIFINSIKIAKQIDKDKTSDTYREPINAFKTITTLDENITKEINYYPLFYIWTSINTENISLQDIQNNDISDSNNINMVKPIKLLMTVKCNDNIIKTINYQINAKTPRWREWVEIDLTQFDAESFKGNWNVEIINKETKEVLESRSFEFEKYLDSKEQETAQLIK